ncbi:hypothetical protein GE21DRAFT_78 [Neurospora crassa]|uniref:Uncharacterized protein n=1 Tax=Neurospora crassa (strain ATCC 24698 / 74-OR23-1A / CBS 708.71 / DSM 1257 / FGSC 987) TaxID=367110 RepID=Q7SCX3_NEUCR|nr:hypothetical protein NCU08107 [Neurospora crassa OR74A]EAA34601.1 hypothetical protein NCU08107 [Neurospora crassa OR74A]KHE84518.1 hypothetical protein GE21DRAFT_78 [Neurospora crassa]|eukprot:XP_963837.1 hypothetical protein NCU08107 [Neurospora crassa OR74A]
MSSSAVKPKRGPPSHTPSPRSDGNDPKRPKLDGHPVIDLTGDSEDDDAPATLRQRLLTPSLQSPLPAPDVQGDSNVDDSTLAAGASDLHEPLDIEDEAGETFAVRRATAVMRSSPLQPASIVQPPRSPSPELKAIEIVDLTGGDYEGRQRSPRSPTPSFDYRIALWTQETREFAGRLILEPPEHARFSAQEACRGPLWVDNVPRIIIFCDGSSKLTPLMTWEGTNGGYGVVLRNPWAAENDENGQGRVVPEAFEVCSWSIQKMYSSSQAELAAIAQSIDTSLRLREKHRHAPRFEVRIFTDSKECWHRLRKGLNQRPERFSFRHTEPILRAVVWLSHRLRVMGGDLEVRWNPRRCAIGPELADDAAGVHYRDVDPEVFNQRNVRLLERDGILGMVHEEISAIVRERVTPPPMPFPLPDWFGER